MNAAGLLALYGNRLAQAWMPHLRDAMYLADISTPTREAMFLAQIGHESGCLRYVREIWGPTPQQLRYEPDTTLSERLGNNQPGDGKRYMGRGLIQTTGRANHAMTTARLRKLLGADVPDFEADPEQLCKPRWAALSAGLFWHVKKLNQFADAGDMVGATKRINGGLNGLAHRQALYTRALALGG